MTTEGITSGMRVHYSPKYGNKENGIVKSVRDGNVFVVYKCAGEWDHYQDYTAANTPVEDLHPGWLNQKELA